jgi:hypothetical protein
MHASLRTFGRICKRDGQRSVQILPCTGRRTEIFIFELGARAARGAAAASEHPAQEILEASASAAARTTETIRSEAEVFEMRTRARSVPTTRLRTEPFEALETWLTFGVNLSAIKCFALVAVANNFVCGVEFSEVRCRLRIVLVGVRVQFFREAPISTLDIGLACTLGNPQDFVGVAHRIQTPVKSPLSRLCTGKFAHLMWGLRARDATRIRTPSADRKLANGEEREP